MCSYCRLWLYCAPSKDWHIVLLVVSLYGPAGIESIMLLKIHTLLCQSQVITALATTVKGNLCVNKQEPMKNLFCDSCGWSFYTGFMTYKTTALEFTSPIWFDHIQDDVTNHTINFPSLVILISCSCDWHCLEHCYQCR